MENLCDAPSIWNVYGESKLKCPRCGCPRAKYEVPAGYKKVPKDKAWERTNHTANCPKCGFHYNAETGKEIIKKLTKEELKVAEKVFKEKVMQTDVLCGLTNLPSNKDSSCTKFEAINQQEKKRCWNCKHHQGIAV